MFTYTPIAARRFAPVALFTWPAFWWLWTAILAGTAMWLGWRHALLVLAFPPVAIELYHGNVHLLIAAAIALGFRYPATWAFVLITKLTPGVGLVWFLVRREWRQLVIALGVTAVLVAVSLTIDGRLWSEWISDALLPVAGTGEQVHVEVPLIVRLPLARGPGGVGARGRTGRGRSRPARPSRYRFCGCRDSRSSPRSPRSSACGQHATVSCEGDPVGLRVPPPARPPPRSSSH